jgi:hypothetical protein
MKPALVISLIVHLTAFWLAPIHEGGAFSVRKAPFLSYSGPLEEIPPALYQGHAEREPPRYSYFPQAEAEAAVIDPPAVSYEAEWTPPPPALSPAEISELFEEADSPGIPEPPEGHGDDYGIGTIPFEERILP